MLIEMSRMMEPGFWQTKTGVNVRWMDVEFRENLRSNAGRCMMWTVQETENPIARSDFLPVTV